MAPSNLMPLVSQSQEHQNLKSVIQPIVKDIREATTVKEVRDIMNQVKSKYKNHSYQR